MYELSYCAQMKKGMEVDSKSCEMSLWKFIANYNKITSTLSVPVYNNVNACDPSKTADTRRNFELIATKPRITMKLFARLNL